MEEAVKPGLWRFGAVELDERLAALRVAGAVVDLDRSSYDILLALLRHAGEVVTKDELLDAGWPGRVVSENSLAKAVSRLRQALGADAGSLRVVHGYGYRLAAAVAFAPVAADTVEAVPHEAARLREGDRLPHRSGWRLGRRLGEGAAGVIFLAVADGGETRAVKLATSETGLRGLKREIALSRYIQSVGGTRAPVVPVLGWNLSHPPFFLELPFHSEGSLRDWATFRGGLAAVPRGERLALAVQLCESVAALHAIGVIHRDLKPENLYPVADASVPGGWRIVLGDLGASDAAASPLLAELGITMSILDTAREGASSRYGGSVLYIAPEAIAGAMPTQRSDLFALGVLVYQLAIGDLRRSLAPGWEAAIDDELLREDIALAAAADPERRIGDAHALAERLRTLAGRHAALAASREAERRHRQQAADFAGMARRRRLLLAGSATLAVFLGMSLWQQHRTDAARGRAEQAARTAQAEAAKTRAVVGFLTDDVLRQADPYSSNSPALTLREAIDLAARDVDARFRDTPDVAAAVHGTLAAAYEGMNDYAAAVRHYRSQLAALRQASPRDLEALAHAHAALCTASLWQGDLPRAVADCRSAGDDHRAAGLEPDRPEVFLALADIRVGRHRQALARLLPRIERIRRSGDHDLLAQALGFEALAHSNLGQLQAMETAAAGAVEARRQEDDRGMYLAWTLADHGKALLLVGREREGRGRLREARALFERIGGKGHPQSFVPDVYLASHELQQGRWQAALDLARPAFEALHRQTGWQHWTLYAALSSMTARAELGDAAGARALYETLSRMAREGGMEQNFPYLREPHWGAFAETLLALGDRDGAATYVAKLRGLLRAPDASPLLAARVACLEAELQRARGELAAARRQAQACLDRYAAAAPAGSPLLRHPERLLAALGGPTAGAATPRAAR